MPDLPSVVITEEGMRDGMQIESVRISLEDKLRLLDALSEAGLRRIVVGSFVSPKWTPQMAEIDALVQRMRPRPGVTYLALALNERGRERMRAHVPPLTIDDRPPSLHAHLCDVFIKRNTNRTIEQERAAWPAIVERAVAAGRSTAMIGLSAAWGSNWRGAFSRELRLARLQEQVDVWQAAGLTVTDVLLADPMGWNMPHWVAGDLRAIKARWPDIRHFRLHLHNQRGMALASIYAALTTLGPQDTLYADSTIGGIGGCPYCGNGRAAGMAPTEDLVQMLEAMGIRTGADLDKLVEAAALAAGIIGRPLDGHVSGAGPLPDAAHLYPPDLPVVETHEQAQHFRLGMEVCEGMPRPWMDAPAARSSSAPGA
ncbi:MAG: citramalate synthase [Armatimonadetes bacterium]|nr:citramalate synthase [Armatimonadota bacterium]